MIRPVQPELTRLGSPPCSCNGAPWDSIEPPPSVCARHGALTQPAAPECGHTELPDTLWSRLAAAENRLADVEEAHGTALIDIADMRDRLEAARADVEVGPSGLTNADWDFVVNTCANSETSAVIIDWLSRRDAAHAEQLAQAREVTHASSGRPSSEWDGECICDYNPETTDGPQEDCPFHGRPYAYWVESDAAHAEQLAQARAEVRARVEAALVQVGYLDLVAKQIREQGDVAQVLMDGEGVGPTHSLADELWMIAFNLRAALDGGEE